MATMTLSFLIYKKGLVLGKKLTGLGQDKWNGFGGKVEAGEEILAAAVREIEEEAKVQADPAKLEKVAVINFFFHKQEEGHCVHVFLLREWEGDPKKTLEMNPAWFALTNIPYKLMWPADELWLPLVLAGKKIMAEFHYDESGKKVESFSYQEAAELF